MKNGRSRKPPRSPTQEKIFVCIIACYEEKANVF
nr:MAG TPA: hypothetical protein [Caudoviricetes sp.]DAV69591.1 MAG TPA: hypothetical protein [Caudoviricetes sp.]